MSSAVVIGTGGVGKEILMRIRRMIVEKYGSLESLPYVQFLHIDTEVDVKSTYTEQFVMGESIRFSTEERIELSESIDMALLHDRNVQDWFPDRLAENLGKVNFRDGAGGIRSYGRFAFHCAIERFNAQLQAKARKAVQAGEGGNVKVYIVSSLFGGTGGGGFLDLCYNVKKPGVVAGLDEVLGFFVIGGDGIKDPQKANCYSALKELEYFSTCGKVDEPGFRVDYPGKPPGSGVNDRGAPIDTCYLIDWINEVNEQFTREQLEECVASRIFLEFYDKVGDDIRQERKDLKNQTIAFQSPDKMLQRAQTFLSFGLSVVEYPAVIISDALAYGLAEDCVEAWSFDDARLNQYAEGDAEKFLRENKLRKDSLLQELRGENVTESSIRNRSGGDIPRLLARVNEQPFNRNAIQVAVENNIAAYDKALRHIYPKNIKGNKEELLYRLRGTVRSAIAEMAGRSDQGVKNAEEFIAFLLAQLESEKQAISNEIMLYEDSRDDAKHRRDKQLTKLQGDLEERFRWEVQQHVHRLYNFAENYLLDGCNELLYKASVEVLEAVIQELKSAQEDCRRFRSTLVDLGKYFTAQKEERKKQLSVADGQPFSPVITITEEELVQIDKEQVPARKTATLEILGELQEALGEKDTEGRVTPTPLFELVRNIARNEQQIKMTVEKCCLQRYGKIRDVSVTSELLKRQTIGAQKDILDGYIKRSQVMVKATLQDETIAFDNQSSYKKFVFHAKDAPDFDKVRSHFREGYIFSPTLTQKYQLIFAEEKGGFPLRSMKNIKIYEPVYTAASKRIFLETDRRMNYKDILPSDPRLEQIRIRSCRSRILGEVFHLLRSHPTEEGYEKIHVFASDDRIQPITESWKDVEEALYIEQLEKDVDRLKDTQTKLELLEAELDHLGSNAKGRTVKEELQEKMEIYLKALLERQDASVGKAGREYQEHSAILREFRKKYHLSAPEVRSEQKESYEDDIFTRI